MRHTVALRAPVAFLAAAALIAGVLGSLGAADPAEAAAPTGRIAGADRYETSAKAAAAAFPGTASTVWIASGENFPDALSAGAAANAHGAPLLLSPHTGVTAPIAAQLKRLKPRRIVVVGGTAAISASAAAALTAYAPVQRISGADRFQTSLAVARAAFTSAKTVYVASGRNYPDALSAAGAAGANVAPVLLVPGNTGGAPTALRSRIAALGATHVYVVGGAAAIDSATAGQLRVRGATVSRAAGADRFATSVAVAATAPYPGRPAVVLASGENFPDALVAGTLSRGRYPVLLSEKSCLPAPVHAAEAGYAARYLVGGTVSLYSTVADDLQCTTALRRALVNPRNVPDVPCYVGENCDAKYLAAINAGRRAEGLGPIGLPAGYGSMARAQQLIAVIDAERTSRGLGRLAESAVLDADALAGARNNSDPSVAHITGAGGTIWAGGYPSVLGADFGWMYRDGPGGENLDCRGAVTAGCFGHRDNILGWFATNGADGYTVDARYFFAGARVGAGYTTVDGVPSYAAVISQ